MVLCNLLKARRFLLLALTVIFVSGSLTGCASLRKKFIRKKKVSDQKEDFIPVLQPQEYEKVELEPIEKYKEHYTMARAYFKDVWETMGSPNAGSKQQVYVLSQLAARIQAMADLLTGEKKSGLEQMVLQIRDVVKEYEKPAGIRRYDLLKAAMQKIEKAFRTGFKPEGIKTELKVS